MDDNLTRNRMMSPSDIVQELEQTASAAGRARQPEARRPAIVEPSHDSDEPEEFDPESTDYKAFGRAGQRALPALRLILKDGSERLFQYAHLDTRDPDGCEFIPSGRGGKGNVIRLRFAGHDSVVMVTMEGLRLRKGWALISGHLTPWAHELPSQADFRGDKEPVIRSIVISQGKP